MRIFIYEESAALARVRGCSESCRAFHVNLYGKFSPNRRGCGMGGSVDDLRQRAAEEIAERQRLDRVVDLEPDADAQPDPLAALRSEDDDDQPRWRRPAREGER
jgi:hypothetical protein